VSAGAVDGPLSNEVLPQILAGGELGHDPLGAGSAVVVVVGAEVAVDVAVEVAVDVAVEVAVDVAVEVAVDVTVGSEVAVDVTVGSEVAVDVTVGSEVAVDVTVGSEVAVEVAVGSEVAVGTVVGGGLEVGASSLLTVNSARLLEVAPFDQVSTALIPCEPLTSFVVSYGSAVPLAAVPAKSNGGVVSVKVGRLGSHRVPSR
jgi:hypothetical protein